MRAWVPSPRSIPVGEGDHVRLLFRQAGTTAWLCRVSSQRGCHRTRGRPDRVETGVLQLTTIDAVDNEAWVRSVEK